MADSTVFYAKKVVNEGGAGGAIYCIGIFGAAIYFLQHSTNFWMVVTGIIKAIFWPAVLVYKVFELLKI